MIARRPLLFPLTLALLCAGSILTGCRPSPANPANEVPDIPPTLFDSANAYNETAAIAACYPRHAGTPGAEQAALHIRNRLQTFGLESFLDSFSDPTPRGTQTFHNVFARLPGQRRGLILLASHYDTKSGIPPPFCGANDSASSSGVLLELARVLGPCTNLPQEILFVFFDGEECLNYYQVHDGLHGSRRLARQLLENDRADDVTALILMDMVGDPAYTITIPQNSSPFLISLAFQAAEQEGIRPQFSLYRYAIGDDHEPFFTAGIPAINLIDFQFGSAPGRNDYWHTPEDQMARISPESLGRTGRVVLHMLNSLLRRE